MSHCDVWFHNVIVWLMVFPPLWDETEDPETPRDTAELSMKMGARVKHKKKVPTKRQGQDEGHHSNQGFFLGVTFLPISLSCITKIIYKLKKSKVQKTKKKRQGIHWMSIERRFNVWNQNFLCIFYVTRGGGITTVRPVGIIIGIHSCFRCAMWEKDCTCHEQIVSHKMDRWLHIRCETCTNSELWRKDSSGLWNAYYPNLASNNLHMC